VIAGLCSTIHLKRLKIPWAKARAGSTPASSIHARERANNLARVRDRSEERCFTLVKPLEPGGSRLPPRAIVLASEFSR
jgi:hypothetical protein